MLPKQNKNKKGFSKRELFISIFFAVMFVGLVGVLITANYKINQKRDELIKKIDGLKKQIQEAQQKNEQLSKDINQANSQEQLEKIAREQMGLKKPGEEVVIIKDSGNENGNENANGSDSQPQNNSTQNETTETKPNPWNPLSWWHWITGK